MHIKFLRVVNFAVHPVVTLNNASD